MITTSTKRFPLRKRPFAFAALLAIATFISTAQEAHSLSAEVKSSIEKAVDSDDVFLVDSVIEKSSKLYPQEKMAIIAYVISYYESKRLPAAPKIEITSWEDEVQASIEAGLLINSGNSDSKNINVKTEISYETEGWKNSLGLSAENNSEDEQRTAEEYRAEYQTRYKLTKRDYVFGEIDWVKDRFSGFDYRLTEVGGYGHKLLDEEKYWLEAEASIGMRQSKPEDSSSENSFIQRLGAEAEWQVLEDLSLNQKFQVEQGGGIFISNSETSAKTKIADNLALKLSFEAEHISDVPENRKKLDTSTKFNILYDFGKN